MTASTVTLEVPEQIRDRFDHYLRDVFQGSAERVEGLVTDLRRSETVDSPSWSWTLNRVDAMCHLAAQAPAGEYEGSAEALGDVLRSVLRSAAENLWAQSEAVVLDMEAVARESATIEWATARLRELAADGAKFEDVPVLRVQETRAG